MSERGRPRSFDRDQALQKAMELFWARGYAGASVAELTQAMGIAAPSLYAAFGGKADLYREAMDRYIATSGGRVWAQLEQPTARGSVEAVLREAARVMTQPGQPAGCMASLSAAQPDDLGAELCAEMAARRGAGLTTFLERLKRGQAEREISEAADLEAMARFYVAVHQGMSLQAREGVTETDLQKLVDAAMAAWEPLTRQA
ncbi:TetR/AcrR family transcriptional regulator [Brevundimonas sp.]|uniref:TetR/AcrR family transcriptional regulator n=1 Tax=Brevundimonas sp. TaxID=1871086 RepID=UPI00181E7B18|nr:TetR/AcrR family transcriptional regulator [Brevundimonas sp.]MBA4806960.1 TetR/AcrR family transcriptional regulator [Brevundimonas sp.]